MGNTSGIKWNGINDAGTLQSSYEIILRDTKTNNEEKILLPDFFNQAITLGLIPSGGSGWGLTGNADTDPSTNFIGTTDGEKFIIQPSTGNVGIGTTNPKKKLDVVGEFSQVATSGGVSVALQSVVGSVNMSQTDGTYTSQLTLNNTEAQLVYNSGTEANTVQPDANGIAFLNNNVENVRLLNNGNVGIGTASPTELFYVDGTDGTTSSIFKVQKNSLFDNVGFRYTGNTATEDSLVDFLVGGLYGIAYVHELGSDYSYIEARANVVNQWRSNGDITLQNTNGDGNVGIGTLSPASKLTVDGDTEVLGSANGVILESPDNTRYRVTVANGGTLTVTAV